jgi:RNA polymerase sigma-70 factor (ECF subfamily)
MSDPAETAPPDAFDARYLAFLETITHLPPQLHRYCARMTGSVLHGEDVAQEALFQAYRKLHSFDDSRPMAPWLFRIAHNRCIDFLRRRGVQIEAETAVQAPDVVPPINPVGPDLGRAVEHLVMALPPKERASVLLKDVFDYTLEEIAELVDSTLGGVKAALSRGRAKLDALPKDAAPPRAASEEMSQLLHLYVDRFNRRDWDGLRELISADARLQVADRFVGRLSDSPYFARYDKIANWRMAVGEVDGRLAIITLRSDADGWTPQSLVRLDVVDDRVARVVDYLHCPWVLANARSVAIADPARVSPAAGQP